MTDASPDADSDAEVIAATRRWIERAVIGLGLCPFARTPFAQQRVRYRVSAARDTEALAADLREEAQRLVESDPQALETTLLIHPHVLDDFLDYNDFLDVAEATLGELDLDADLQIASFHPRYQFGDAEADAIENCTNRSPYPILHLLRVDSVEAAVESVRDPEAIYQRNIDTLRRLGPDGWNALWDDQGDISTRRRND
ncbi:DUF1415 domain-containing protein [Dokdonella sp.]|uniref:DUF1415 domain-containing protein n=1 Tax=Dokdonella sp. TaxID=2291710 RepID=UPI001B1E294A|nr:DUF1415 domain-containing protein [Dokdonella sp.]MBO9664112.1 DUF1415 domain-containing protein [Dokdonella sp.]